MKRTASLILFLAGGLIAGSSNGNHAQVSPEILNSSDSEMDVLLVYEDSDDAPARQQRDDKVRSFGGRNFRNFQGLGIGAVRTSRALLDELKKDAKIRFIAPDRPIRATASGSATYDQVTVRTVLGVTSSVPQTGASVGVAVIDSGVSNLPGFGTSGACSTSRIVYSQNFASDAGTNDLFGHGSHVASILGSNASCDASYSTSVAPGVRIINLRVLNALGIGSDSGVISAIDRAVALKNTYNIRVINLSLGRTVADSFVNDPLCQAVERAWKAGIVVVAAAGNMGRYPVTNGYATIASPANDPFIITVGAMRDPSNGLANSRNDDTITTYSSKGPSVLDHIVKPDLVAPGNLMVAKTMFPSTLTRLLPGNLKDFDNINGHYFKLSGTSMAAPVVAGAVALLIQKDPTLTPDQVKFRLMKTAWKGMTATASIYDSITATACNVQHDIFTVGSGYVDIAAALASAEKIGSTQSAVSPRVLVQNGKVVLTASYTNPVGLNVVWGTSAMSANNVIWGTNVLLANNVVWGDNVIWGANVAAGYNVIWGDNVIWGTSAAFPMAATGAGDN